MIVKFGFRCLSHKISNSDLLYQCVIFQVGQISNWFVTVREGFLCKANHIFTIQQPEISPKTSVFVVSRSTWTSTLFDTRRLRGDDGPGTFLLLLKVEN